jgi:hypothetical protein
MVRSVVGEGPDVRCTTRSAIAVVRLVLALTLLDLHMIGVEAYGLNFLSTIEMQIANRTPK